MEMRVSLIRAGGLRGRKAANLANGVPRTSWVFHHPSLCVESAYLPEDGS